MVSLNNKLSGRHVYNNTEILEYNLEITYKNHGHAEKYSYYPGAKRVYHKTIKITSGHYFEILRALMFIKNTN